ncbi:MAG: hypothetical protein IKE94_01475 [Aeriscardovia sp.]|nr:hypothetical protein [Aeriscardovia sp.]MBR3461571.1 hypothetical protein [Clostridiales bacterium]
MRYYGEDYKQHTINALDSVRDAVAGSDYAQIIRNTDVSTNNGTLKIECVQAGSNAYAQVDLVREKLNKLVTILRPFYDGVDETSDAVLKSAEKIAELLEETNTALVRMNSAINGIGEYTGTKVTPEILIDAGLDEEKCIKLKDDFWDKIISIRLANDKVSYSEAAAFVDYISALQKNGLPIPDIAKKHLDELFGVYIGMMQSFNPNMILTKDKERLEAIYNYYCIYHLGPNNNVTELSEQTLKNCIDVYELINPDAKKVTNVFFKDAYAMSDDVISSNVQCIKYTLYTADPEERDLMLYFMPLTKLNILEPGATACSNYIFPPVINLDLRDGNAALCCSFFHEFGHILDFFFFFSSNMFMNDMVQDLTNHMHNALAEMGISLPADQEQEVIDYFFTCENSNVINSDGYDWPYPSNWTTSQAMAYYQLKDYYGYKEYVYNPSEYASDDNKAYKIYTVNGYTNGFLYGTEEESTEDTSVCTAAAYYIDQAENKATSESEIPWYIDYRIISDSIGGLTNNQIGCTCYGHYANYDDILNDAAELLSYSNLHNQLELYDYFYNTDKDYSLTSSVAHEFFAENWEYDVFGFDKEITYNTFPSACQEYDKAKEAMFEAILG